MVMGMVVMLMLTVCVCVYLLGYDVFINMIWIAMCVNDREGLWVALFHDEYVCVCTYDCVCVCVSSYSTGAGA